MRPALRLLATPTITSTRSSFRPTPPALLPPIHLYRRLLRSHRKYLPTEERLLGDEYVKAEFRAHRKIDNPIHIVGFLSEWQLYAQGIEGEGWRGEKMDREKVDKMSDEQVAQMYELMQEIKRRGEQEAEEEVAAATTKEGRGE